MDPAEVTGRMVSLFAFDLLATVAWPLSALAASVVYEFKIVAYRLSLTHQLLTKPRSLLILHCNKRPVICPSAAHGQSWNSSRLLSPCTLSWSRLLIFVRAARLLLFTKYNALFDAVACRDFCPLLIHCEHRLVYGDRAPNWSFYVGDLKRFQGYEWSLQRPCPMRRS